MEKRVKIDSSWREYLVQRYSKPANEDTLHGWSQELDSELEIHPNNPINLASKSAVLCMLGDHTEALQASDYALALNTGERPWVLGVKGRILRMIDRVDEAIDVLREAVHLDPELSWGRAELAEALRSLGRYKESLDVLSDVDKSQLQDIFIFGTLGILLGKIAEYERSISILENAIELDSSIAWLWGYQGRAYQQLGNQMEKALGAYEQAHRLELDDPRWQLGIANIQYLLGNVQHAKERYHEIVRKLNTSTISAKLQAIRGWCHYQLGEYKSAVQWLIKSLSLDPNNVRVRFNLALALVGYKEYDLAKQEYLNGLETAKHQSALRRRALLQVALQDLEAVVDISPDTSKHLLSELVELLKKTLEQSISPSLETDRTIPKIKAYIVSRIAASLEKPVGEISKDDLPRVKKLDLSSLGLMDEDLACLTSFTSLKWLSLRRTSITADGIQHLAVATTLEELYLKETRISDDSVSLLAPLTSLRVLDLGNTKIDDTSMEHLRHLNQLEELSVRETAFTDDGASHLARLTHLRIIDMRDTKITNTGLWHLINLEHLEQLRVARTCVNSDGANSFKREREESGKKPVQIQL
jgi:tetratricopeptide (TPR) repeat protein